ncbi:hypothetical protein F4777DRAFT_53726 [Nemania sp. FL0916]|nr:hypothetical protein F4777DRAFT_53726 [Nemania sp. FL0916]
MADNNKYDRGYFQTPGHVIAAGIGLSVLDILALGLRFVARRRQQQPLKADDWLLVPATLLTLGIGISMVYAVSQHGLAYPFVLPPGQDDPFNVVSRQLSIEGAVQWAYTVMLPLALGCSKLSFLLFYRRIFAIDGSSKTNIFLVGMCIFVTAWMIAFFLIFLFLCKTSFWALWTSASAIMEHCLSDTNPNFSMAITDAVTDVVIFITPLPLVLRLNLTVKKKIAVTCVFLVGLITVAASLTRLVLTARILAVGYDRDADPICESKITCYETHAYGISVLVTSFVYWGMVESGIAVFVACLPTLWMFSRWAAWTPLVRVITDLANSSLSSLGLLRTRNSKRSVEHGTNQHAPRKSSASTLSAYNPARARIPQGEDITPNYETYPLRTVTVEATR